MQENSKEGTLTQLVTKISHLRKRLISYGWNEHETLTFILFQFLKLPMIEWTKIDNTVTYYEIKDQYGCDGGTAELILCLRQLVPDLQKKENQIVGYLNSLFQYNAISYGFEILESSSDSGDTPTFVRLKSKVHRKPRGMMEKKERKRNYELKEGHCKKRLHLDDGSAYVCEKPVENDLEPQYDKKQKRLRNRQQQPIKIIKKRKPLSFSEVEDENQKKIKRDD